MTTDPVFMKADGQYYFYQNDHLGTPQKITAINGAVVWSAKYSSFGRADVDSFTTITNNLRFPGQYFVEETELHYNRYRSYDPKIGRFLIKDPLGLAGGINFFPYASNLPVSNRDPMGLVPGDGLGIVRGYSDLHNNRYKSQQVSWDSIKDSVKSAPGEMWKDFVSDPNWNLSFYWVGGAEVSNLHGTCCENNRRYSFHILIVCGGLGAGTKFSSPLTSTEAEISIPKKRGCPFNNDWYIGKSYSGGIYRGYSGAMEFRFDKENPLTLTGSKRKGDFGAEIVFVKYCSVSLLRKDNMGECCEK
jgi:RHS repeat-associated protein